ncbi:hypothetical protein PRtIB026_A34920 [Pseudomonas sp. RtIB026]|nr:hypothetical protein PRtIB026_A34920 [Pseudomonas sp. RtIB026]
MCRERGATRPQGLQTVNLSWPMLSRIVAAVLLALIGFWPQLPQRLG